MFSPQTAPPCSCWRTARWALCSHRTGAYRSVCWNHKNHADEKEYSCHAIDTVPQNARWEYRCQGRVIELTSLMTRANLKTDDRFRRDVNRVIGLQLAGFSVHAAAAAHLYAIRHGAAAVLRLVWELCNVIEHNVVGQDCAPVDGSSITDLLGDLQRADARGGEFGLRFGTSSAQALLACFMTQDPVAFRRRWEIAVIVDQAEITLGVLTTAAATALSQHVARAVGLPGAAPLDVLDASIDPQTNAAGPPLPFNEQFVIGLHGCPPGSN